MTVGKRSESIFGWFRDNMPVAESELDFESPYQLLTAVILSAQCTDRRVNMTTPALFRRFPDPAALAAASPDEVLPIISSISFPNNKARHLIGMARALVERFGGEVPSDIESLVTIPGVGLKTAKVIAAVIYGKPVIAVDTHIFRVAHRLGLSSGKTPEAVSADLEREVPEADRPIAHHWLLLHGRYVCTARKPKCAECGLAEWCRGKSI